MWHGGWIGWCARWGATALFITMPFNANATTGNDILAKCQFILQDGGVESVEEALAGTHCAGYVGGLNDMLALWRDFDERVAYCTPREGLETVQVIRVFAKWLKENPERLHETARLLFFASMRDSFPCG